MTLRPTLVTAPGLVVSVAEMKAQTRVSWADDDLYIESLIRAATNYLQNIAGRCFLEQEWVQLFCEFSDKMRLPKGDLISVSEIKHYDADNELQTTDPALYAGFTDFGGAFIALKDGASWPATATRLDAVSVKWKAGYSDNADEVPDGVKHAIKLLTAHWYANREAVSETAMQNIPHGVHDLIGKEWVPYA